MKLQLKHLAPYLPYDLKMKKEDSGKIGTLVPWVTFKEGLQIELDSALTLQYKPILRPLSDLTINEYWNLSGKDKNKEFGFWYGKDVNGEYLHFEGYTSRQIRKDKFKTLPHYAFEFLIENHFDVFGLIEKGLAIDINNLKLLNYEIRN